MRTLLPFLLIATCMPVPAFAIELDESPAQPGEWGFRPADCSTQLRNPPGFSWRPAKGAATYTIEIAADEAFNDVVYRADTQWPAHCPSEDLPTGDLYWRYRATNDGGAAEWSMPRKFTIDPDAVVHPQPPVAELAKRLPDERPRLFMRPEQIDKLRAAADGPLSDAWAAVQSRADSILKSPPDISEPPLYPPGTERKGEAWKKIWWGNRRHAIAVADGAATLGFVYRITGDEKYGQAARDLLMAVTAWDPEGSTQYRYNDEAAMPLLYMTSRAYDWAYPVLSEEDRAAVIEMMRIRGGQCYDHLRGRQHLWYPYASHSNRAWHWLAEVATTFHGEIPEADDWLDFGMTVYFTAYPVWNDSDGGWHEGAAYWSSYVSRFLQWAYIMKTAYGIDAFERPYFDNAGNFALYLMPPGTTHGGFGDQAPKITSSRAASLMAILASGAGNPYWQWYAKEHDVTLSGGYLDFFYRMAAHDLEAKAPADLPTSTVFRGTGVAVMNTNLTSADNNVQLLFKSSPLGRISHGYNANNAIHINVHGKPLFVNTGRRDIHGSPHHRQWMYHTKSQNAILVNGEGQLEDRDQSVGRIRHFDTDDAIDYVAGDAGSAYASLDRWTRHVLFIKPDVFIIYDAIEAAEPATVQWLLHAPTEFDLSSVDEGRVKYQADHATAHVYFLAPEKLSIKQHNEYDPPPHDWANFDLNEWHLTAGHQNAAKRHEFITVMRIDDAPPIPALEEYDGVKILRGQSDAGEYRIQLNADRCTWSVRGEAD